MKTRHMILSAADDLLGGGGNGGNPDPAPKNNDPAPEPKPDDKKEPQKGSLPENWKDFLPDEIKNDPSIKSLKDVQALAKSYIHGQKLVGKDKIIIPDQNTSDEEWSKIYNKLGMPEDQTKYEFKVPEGADAEFVKSFKEFGHKNGILPKQAEKLFGWFSENAAKIQQQEEEINKNNFNQTVDSLKREWGQAYDRKLSNASGLFKQFADEDTRKELREIGFSNHPKVLKLFAKIADSFGEGKFVNPGSGTGGMGYTPEEADKKITEVYAQYPNHPYFNKNNAGHEAARNEMAKWQAAKLAGKK
jgi:hypothetical protein